MEYAVIGTGALVLSGYAATPLLGKSFDWRNLEKYKRVWAVSAVATVLSYGFLFWWAWDSKQTDALELLTCLNSFAALWGWAYALLTGLFRDIVATAAVIGTAGASVGVCAAVALETRDALVLAAAGVLVWQHLVVDGLLDRPPRQIKQHPCTPPVVDAGALMIPPACEKLVGTVAAPQTQEVRYGVASVWRKGAAA